MNVPTMHTAFAAAVACFASAAFGQHVVHSAPADKGATTVYRQVMPDGRIVYSDKAVQGGKIDHTIKVEPVIKGNLWTTEAGPKPVVAPQAEHTPIKKLNTAPLPGRKSTVDEVNSEVIRAEMLLEDAKKQLEAGAEPLPGERTGNASGGSRLNEAYHARQRALVRGVADAEAALKKAQAERDALLQ